MSNVCNTCSNLVDLTTLICGSSTCSYNYRFNLWFDENSKAGFLIYNSLIPDDPLRLTTIILSPSTAPTGEEVGQEFSTQLTSSKS